MTAEEEAALSNWLLNPDKPKNVSIDDNEALTVDAKEPFIFEQARQMKGGNSDLAGTPDGLAGPTTALFTLAYYVTIDDAVVLLEPNSSPDEKAVAGLFLLPTPGKFAKPFLKHADDMGGAGNAGRKTGSIVKVNNKIRTDSATTSRKGGETLVGHALEKHAGRHPDVWGQVKGGPSQINKSALRHLEDILDAPGDFTKVTNHKGIDFLEKNCLMDAVFV